MLVGWCIWSVLCQFVFLEFNGVCYDIEVYVFVYNCFMVYLSIGLKEYMLISVDDGLIDFECEGWKRKVCVVWVSVDLMVFLDGYVFVVVLFDIFGVDDEVVGVGDQLIVLMLGFVKVLMVQLGDVVKQDQLLVILEVMKMEYILKSLCDGVIGDVNVFEGDQVIDGIVFLVLVEEIDVVV